MNPVSENFSCGLPFLERAQNCTAEFSRVEGFAQAPWRSDRFEFAGCFLQAVRGHKDERRSYSTPGHFPAEFNPAHPLEPQIGQ